MSDSSMYPFHPKLPGAAPCLCPLHHAYHASCTGVTPRPRLRARVSHAHQLLLCLQIPLIPVYVRFVHVPLPPEAARSRSLSVPLHHASCTGVTPRPRLRARVSQKSTLVDDRVMPDPIVQ
ncbi:hypothetical protein LR48_Vigan04g030300 [Vigna angularis]|uniref:Uncharacterized protein n=1 Tax=Phaseolus angularis TaxID=3914 RepID=A0A0L9UB13_PHAAN|nr:hypothetical protein LR48_Vigan04g030300 [Vigna angularis]